jgi:hypothetical protein
MKKKILTTAKSKKKSSVKSAAKRTKRRRRIGITGPYGFFIYDDGTMETKEERKKRLAKLDAMTLKAFQMMYDDHHPR